MRFSYRRVAFFEDFERWKIICYFGDVLGGFWGEFWEGFGPCEVDFRALKTDQISKPKLEPEKVVPDSRRGSRGGVTGVSGGPKLVNDE